MDLNPWEDEVMYKDDNSDELYEKFREASKQDRAVIIGSNGRIMSSNAYLLPPKSAKEEAQKGSRSRSKTYLRLQNLDII